MPKVVCTEQTARVTIGGTTSRSADSHRRGPVLDWYRHATQCSASTNGVCCVGTLQRCGQACRLTGCGVRYVCSLSSRRTPVDCSYLQTHRPDHVAERNFESFLAPSPAGCGPAASGRRRVAESQRRRHGPSAKEPNELPLNEPSGPFGPADRTNKKHYFYDRNEALDRMKSMQATRSIIFTEN